MESSEIIKKFIGRGFQLDRRTLDYLVSNQEKVESSLEKLSLMDHKPLIVTLDALGTPESEAVSISVYRKFDEGRTPKTINEVLKYFQSRYNKISEMLSGRPELTNLISVNKISDKTRQFSVICMVKEKDENENSVSIEDLTGGTKMFFRGATDSFKQIVLDEVVGLVCENDNGTNFVKSVVTPGVPLKKESEHTNGDVYCYFISDIHFDAENFDEEKYKLMVEKFSQGTSNKIFFILGGISKKYEHISKLISDLPAEANKVLLVSSEDEYAERPDRTTKVGDPCIIGVNNIRIFLSHGIFLEKYFAGSDKPPAENLLSLIQKRHLNPAFGQTKKISDPDPYLLDTVPDVFAIGHFHKPSLVNHKGITVLSTGSIAENPTFWKINLKNRENIKVDLI